MHMNTDIYTITGKKSGSIDLPDAVFGVAWNDTLMHQVVTSMQANARTPVAHAKDRGNVRGGGKKPWQQKGTGRARHGSIRSPIWKGGGVTHGPTNEKDYSRKINKKVRSKALAMALSQKMRDGEVLFVDTVTFTEPKASEAKSVLGALGGIKGYEGIATRRNNAVFIAMNERNSGVQKSFSNFGNVEVDEVRNLNPIDVLSHKYIIISNPEESIKNLSARMEFEKGIK